MSDLSPEVEIIELGKIRIPVDRTVLTLPILETIREGRYENARLKCLRPMIQAGDRIVDIGGGIGFTSALMAKEGRAELVVCIEGHPGVQDMIRALHNLNGLDVEAVCALVVTENKGGATRPFYLSKHFWGSSMLPITKDLDRVVDVPVMTFGDIIARWRPNTLVIDLEVLKEYLRPEASSGPLESMQLDGVEKVVLHIVRHLGGERGIKRVFDFFSAQGFYYNIDYSRGAVVMFSRLPPVADA